MSDALVLRYADTDDINTIGFLAQQIWPVAYGNMISSEQISYMLNLFYSPASLNEQMKKKKHQFVIAELEEEPVGFASYSENKLHKLYVLPETQGKGVGKALIDFVADEVRPSFKTLQLGVNKNNKAIQFYERMGFSIAKEEVTDIGGGFVMDDYIMEKSL